MNTPAARRAIRALGRELTPEVDAATRRILSGAVPQFDRRAARVVRGQRYGMHEQQVVDVFVPSGHQSKRPAIIFVPGYCRPAADGGCPLGEWDNVGLWAAASGFVALDLCCRPPPELDWAVGAEDLAAVVAWATLNIGAFGGDDGAIFLIGHSFGASRVATYLANRSLRLTGASQVSGAVMLSGLYALDRASSDPQLAAVPPLVHDRGPVAPPLPGLATLELPMLFTVAELDAPETHLHAHLLGASFLAERGELPHLLYLAGNNQLTSALQLGTELDGLGPLLLDFIGDASSGP